MHRPRTPISSSVDVLLPFQQPRIPFDEVDDGEFDPTNDEYSNLSSIRIGPEEGDDDTMLELYRQAVPLVQPQSTAAIKTLGAMVRNRELVKRMLQRPQPFAKQLDRRPIVHESPALSKSASIASIAPQSALPLSSDSSTLETPSHRRLTFMAACEKLMVTFDPQVQHSRRLKFVHIKPLLRFHGLEVDDASFRRWEQRLSLSSATDAATSAGPTVSVSEFIQGCQLWFTEAIIVEHARNLQQQQDARRLKHKKLLPLEYEPPQSPAREKQAPFDELARESGAAGTFSYEKYACHPPPRTSTLSASASAPALLHAKYCAHNQPDPFTLATATKLKNDNLEQRRKKKEADASARRTRKQTMEMARNFSSSVAMISRHVHNEEMRDHRTTELEKQIARVEETRQWSQLHEAHCKAIEQDAREQRTREVRAMKTLAEEELRFTRDFRVLREEAVRRNKPLFSMSSSTSTIIPAPPELLAARAAATTQQDRKRLARVEREHAEHMRSLQLLDYAYDRKRMLDEANQPRADSALVEVDVADEELPADRIVQLAGDELWRQIAQQQEQGDPDSLALLMPSSNSPPAALRYFGVSRPVSLPAFSSAVDRNL